MTLHVEMDAAENIGVEVFAPSDPIDEDFEFEDDPEPRQKWRLVLHGGGSAHVVDGTAQELVELGEKITEEARSKAWVDGTPFEKALRWYGDGTDGSNDLDDLDPKAAVLLVERNGDRYWLSTHDSPASAADYHDSQDDAEWIIKELIDLRTGEKFYAESHTTWAAMPA